MDQDAFNILIAGKTTDEAMTYLAEPVAIRERVAVASVKAWALKQMTPNGDPLMWALKKASSDTNDPTGGLAFVILEAVGVNMPPWDMDDIANITMMGQAVAAQFLTNTQVTELRALADQTIPRYKNEGLGPVARWQVEEVLA